MSKKIDVMVDIEAMSLSANAAILSIGAVVFDVGSGVTGSTFEVGIDPVSAECSGGHVCADTMRFWATEAKDAARWAAFSGTNTHIDGLILFATWLESLSGGDKKSIRLWANGPDYDLVIMTNAYRRERLDIPWRFRNQRCYRTMRAMLPAIDLPGYGSHNALQDALFQAKYLMVAMATAGMKPEGE